jgi:hypothetical protein
MKERILFWVSEDLIVQDDCVKPSMKMKNTCWKNVLLLSNYSFALRRETTSSLSVCNFVRESDCQFAIITLFYSPVYSWLRKKIALKIELGFIRSKAALLLARADFPIVCWRAIHLKILIQAESTLRKRTKFVCLFIWLSRTCKTMRCSRGWVAISPHERQVYLLFFRQIRLD